MEPVHTERYKGLLIEIHRTDSDYNPRENTTLGKMLCIHPRHSLGDEHKMSVEEIKMLVAGKDVISLPLYLYDHSGLTMSTSNDTYPFNCRWDSSMVGYITVTRSTVRAIFGKRRVSKKLLAEVIHMLEGEVEDYNYYLHGEIYGFVIKSADGKKRYEDCWGFIGDYKVTLSEAKEVANYHAHHRRG